MALLRVSKKYSLQRTKQKQQPPTLLNNKTPPHTHTLTCTHPHTQRAHTHTHTHTHTKTQMILIFSTYNIWKKEKEKKKIFYCIHAPDFSHAPDYTEKQTVSKTSTTLQSETLSSSVRRRVYIISASHRTGMKGLDHWHTAGQKPQGKQPTQNST